MCKSVCLANETAKNVVTQYLINRHSKWKQIVLVNTKCTCSIINLDINCRKVLCNMQKNICNGLEQLYILCLHYLYPCINRISIM